MRRTKIVDHDFREGWLAFQNNIAVSDNPYINYMGRAEAWESGWRDAEKSRGAGKTSQGKTFDILGTARAWIINSKTSRQIGRAIDTVGTGIIWIIGIGVTIGILIALGIALFGGWFEARGSVMTDTAKAQGILNGTLYLVFNEFGRLDIREDCSVRVYMSKRSYMQVPYPDRDKAIRAVGEAWCKDKEIGRWRLPKVVLRDIETGEELGSYLCLTGWVSKQ